MQDGGRPATDSLPDVPTDRVHVRVPIDVRSTSLALLALIGGISMLHWAGAVFIPLMLSMLLSYVFSPWVNIAAAVLDLVPYVGAVVMTATSALVEFLQFGTLGMATLIGGASVVIHGISYNLVTPWLTNRASHMNPVAIFVGVLAWGWLWGVWGLLLGVPLLMAIKAVCDRVANLKPVSELAGS